MQGGRWTHVEILQQTNLIWLTVKMKLQARSNMQNKMCCLVYSILLKLFHLWYLKVYHAIKYHKSWNKLSSFRINYIFVIKCKIYIDTNEFIEKWNKIVIMLKKLILNNKIF